MWDLPAVPKRKPDWLTLPKADTSLLGNVNGARATSAARLCTIPNEREYRDTHRAAWLRQTMNAIHAALVGIARAEAALFQNTRD